MLFFTDCIRHILLDSIQPHNDMGFPSLLFHSGLLLQLRDRRPVRRLPHESHVRGQLLVHHSPNRHNIHNARARVALLLRRRVPDAVRPRPIQAAHAADPLAPEPGRVAHAVRAPGAALDTLRLRVRASGGLRAAHHVRQDHAQTAESGLHYTAAGHR